MAEESNNYWAGIVTGLIVGGGAALLLSLKGGQESPPNLAEGTQSLQEKAAGIGSGLSQTVTHSVQSLRERGEELIAQARHENEDAFDDPSDFIPIAATPWETKTDPPPGETGNPPTQAHDVIDSV